MGQEFIRMIFLDSFNFSPQFFFCEVVTEGKKVPYQITLREEEWKYLTWRLFLFKYYSGIVFECVTFFPTWEKVKLSSI